MKIAICIPVYGMTHAKFTQSLANMIVHSLGADLRDPAGAPVRLRLETFMVGSSMLTESRHRLAAEALAWEADHMLCLDADHIFPPDTLVRLLAHNLPVVGCNYPRRFSPTAPTAAALPTDGEKEGGLLYTTEEKARAGEVEACAHLGFGVLLIEMRVFDALQARAEADAVRDGLPADGANFLPLFLFEPTADKVGMVGEDVFFFRKLAAAGIRPYCDHRLSWEIGHCHEAILTNRVALSQREAWDRHWRRVRAKFAGKAREIEARAQAKADAKAEGRDDG